MDWIPLAWEYQLVSSTEFVFIYRREVVVHKTFHRYTVRAKRGTAQGLRDARGGASRSAGANLRRYNEVTLCKVSQAS